MKVAMICSADEVRVRLCFLVNVRKANGRSVAAGKEMGRIEGVVGSEVCFCRSGCTGVPKAAEEEGIGLVSRIVEIWETADTDRVAIA